MQTLAIVKGAFLPRVCHWVNLLHRFLRALVHGHVESALLSLDLTVYLQSAKSVLCRGDGK